MKRLFCLCFIFGISTAFGQVPDSPASQNSAPPPAQETSKPKSAEKSGGSDINFDPGAEVLTWNGHSWNINNNRLFQARFEKYLNAPAETDEAYLEYQKTINIILDKLAASQVTTKSVDEAFRLLPKCSNFEIDARMCDALANAVYSAWQSRNERQRIMEANKVLEQERKNSEWNAMITAKTSETEGNPTGNRELARQRAKEIEMQRNLRMQPYATRLAEMTALIKTNQAKKELSALQAKIEFQALIVQFFLQRRFQHVLIGTRFYRAIFSDGDTTLKISGDSKNLFTNPSGLPPTVGTLDSMASETIRDAREGVQAYLFLLEKNELESATKRLGESFIVGEYLPELRTLSRDKKRQALDFTRKGNQLISAIEVKDYSLAEKLVKDLENTAKDFDNSKPMAAIETARAVSAMHIAKARNAAMSGDNATLEKELAAATEIWPRNPDLTKVSGIIFKQSDVQQQALVDLERLISQKNFRQVFEDRVRFIAATALYPEKQDQLKKVLEDMQTIEGAIIRSNEIAKRGDYAGAWENVEKVFTDFPDDNKLNQLRTSLTTQAADFVKTLRTAQDHEKNGQTGSGLAWYLKLQKIYPPSEFAKEGIDRLSRQIIPDSNRL